ncbi:MAG: uracil-DNA glycosylase family protein [Anaerolineae bacterium]|jgi:uracil-DNA glycosylase family 4|nr:uracil-DNA glycosylase [Chloroflexota bacterium]
MESLDALADQVRQCARCRLSRTRTNAVPGNGAGNARLMFVGEAPGFHEDQQGSPFVGAAGHLLDTLLASINLSRERVYITNVVKCRPPDNRDPQPDEIEACRGFLDCQLAMIKPAMVVTLGRFSMQLAYSGVSISRVHGQPKRVGDVIYYPMFHPAAALHQPRYRSLLEQDMRRIPEILSSMAGTDPTPAPPAPPAQLTLF